MPQYTGFEANGYDADVSSDFDSFEYSSPRNAHDAVFTKQRTYRTVTEDDTDLISNDISMINYKIWGGYIATIKPIHLIKTKKRIFQR